MSFNEKIFVRAVREAEKGVRKGHGGPFGAVIVRNGVIISAAHNEVLKRKDPTAHAEILAIRKAAKKLGEFHLQDCSIYSTCEPCPMCLAAIFWARIHQCYYVCSRHDAEKIGFDDNKFYDLFNQSSGKNEFELIKVENQLCYDLFDYYKSLKGKVLY